MIDISVVIAAFNAESFLEDALMSIAGSGLETEVIIVDDASTDSTANVARRGLETLSEQGIRGTVIRQVVNGGPAKARNAGISAASGRWIAVLDADDLMTAGRLRRLVELGDLFRADMVGDNIRYRTPAGNVSHSVLFRDGGKTGYLSWREFSRMSVPNRGPDIGLMKPIFLNSFMREYQVKYRENVRHGEDFLLYADAIQLGARVVIDTNSFYQWTIRTSGNSRTRVNYAAIAADSAALAQRERVAGRVVVARSFERRRRVLLTVGQRSQLAQAIRASETAKVVAVSARRPIRSLLAAVLVVNYRVLGPRRIRLSPTAFSFPDRENLGELR